MTSQTVFCRYELKYLVTKRQRDRLLQAMEPYMSIDRFGHSEIRNLYYDTSHFQLIRASLEQPVYKEKIRLRSYGWANSGSTVYAELKKKYMGVVYKRRIGMEYADALKCLSGLQPMPDSQIGRELSYTLCHYDFPEPKVFLSCEREAFFLRDGGDFRVTFDENIRYRQHDLTLGSDSFGTSLLGMDQVLMELKTPDSIPFWMARTLSELDIRKTPFSKYGAAYTKIFQLAQKGVYRYA